MLIAKRAARLLEREESDDEDDAPAPEPPRKRVRSDVAAPAAVRRICTRHLPFLSGRAGESDVAALIARLDEGGRINLAQLVRVLFDVRTGMYAGLVAGRNPQETRMSMAGIFAARRPSDSSRRSFTIKVSYVERALIAEYAALCARYLPGVDLGDDGRSIAVKKTTAVRAIIPPSRPTPGCRIQDIWDGALCI